MNGRRVVVTGMGAVTPFGIGTGIFRQGIQGGCGAASLITSFDVSKLPTQFAGQVPASTPELASHVDNQKSVKTMPRHAIFAIIAAKEAFEGSGLDMEREDPYRVGVSVGSGGLGLLDLDQARQSVEIVLASLPDGRGADLEYASLWKNTIDLVHPLTPLKGLANIAAAHLAINFDLRGNCQTIGTACTSSAQAIGEAYRQIAWGVADAMIAGGSDSMVNPQGLCAFSGFGVMSRNNAEFQTAARPFDRRRDGFMLGEGAAIFVLEDLEHCRKRGGQPLAEIIGYASTCDAFRLTDEPPDARGSVEAMRRALEDARQPLDGVHYVNAHGTGTRMNDKTETLALKVVFGRLAERIPVSSTKSMVGHLVAGAGAVEFAACVTAIEDQIIPPTINYREPDPECDLDYVPNAAREARLDVVVSNSFGFGGQNACLVIRTYR